MSFTTMTMQRVLLYSGCFLSPLLLFLSVLGIGYTLDWLWSVALVDQLTDWSADYVAAPSIRHFMASDWPSNTLLRLVTMTAAFILVTLVVLGVTVAVRVSQQPQIVYSWILLGALVPVVCILTSVVVDIV